MSQSYHRGSHREIGDLDDLHTFMMTSVASLTGTVVAPGAVERGMRRAWVLLLALPLLAACGSREPVTFPTDRVEVVAGYTLGGGMMPVAYHVIEAPVLLVYSDGRVVSGASRTLPIPAEELADLVGDLRDYLEDLGDVDSAEARQVMDAPSTTLAVRSADGSLTKVTAAALGIVDDYPRALTRSYDLLADLAKRADTTGSPYTSDGIRLVLERRDNPTGSVRAWPSSVDVPPNDNRGLRSADLSGSAAQAVAAALPADAWKSGAWPVYRLPDGTTWGAVWRYLAPGEDDL